MAQTRAAFDAAKADYTSAALDLARTEIKAPFVGRVRDTSRRGRPVHLDPARPSGRIFSTDVAEIRLPMTDGDLAKLGVPLDFSETPENPGPPVILPATLARIVSRVEGAHRAD